MRRIRRQMRRNSMRRFVTGVGEEAQRYKRRERGMGEAAIAFGGTLGEVSEECAESVISPVLDGAIVRLFQR